MMQKRQISFVIPVYKSEKTLAAVVNDINSLPNLDWEAILVNDNSPDGVDKIIKSLISKYPKRIISISFRKNYGQHAAVMEGLKHISKPYVATIDDDGQNPPAEVLKMLDGLIAKNHDLIYGVARKKEHSLVRRLLSLFNKYLSVITIGNNKMIPVSNVRLFRSYLAESLADAPSNYNYTDGLLFSLTDHIGYIEVQNLSRKLGRSNYTFFGLLKLWINHAVGYSNAIIKSIVIFSFCISVASCLVGLIYLILTFNNVNRPSGWLSLYLTISFFSSMIFLILGILAEYLGRIYVNINQTSKKIAVVSNNEKK